LRPNQWSHKKQKRPRTRIEGSFWNKKPNKISLNPLIATSQHLQVCEVKQDHIESSHFVQILSNTSGDSFEMK
jgi:hypothetical protein